MFGGNKTSKREQLDTNDYTVQMMHTVSRPENLWAGTNYIQFGAYDPGCVNFGIRFERRYFSGEIVGLLYARITPYDSVAEEGAPKTENTYYQSLTEFLIKHHDIVRGCHYHLIERQLKECSTSCRIQQHVQTYLATVFRDAPLMPYVIEVSAKLKGSLLGLPREFNKPAAKKWSAAKALELLKMRGDYEGVKVMEQATKKDDVADVVCMIEAMCMVLGYPVTVPWNPIEDDGSELRSFDDIVNLSNIGHTPSLPSSLIRPEAGIMTLAQLMAGQ